LRPLQVVLNLRRLAVFVDPEEAHIEVEARKLEVVRIAAEERDLLLGREDQADVGVALETIKMIRAALVERDDIAPQARLLARLLFDFRDDLAASLRRVFPRR